MIKATEEISAPIVALHANEFGWTQFKYLSSDNDEAGSDLFEVVLGSDAPDKP